jgi:hypothetical protein
VREVAPGASELFTVIVGGIDDSLVDYAVVLNYPPASLLHRAFIEPTADVPEV